MKLAALLLALPMFVHAQTAREAVWIKDTLEVMKINHVIEGVLIVSDASPNESPVAAYMPRKGGCKLLLAMRDNRHLPLLDSLPDQEALRLHAIFHEEGHCALRTNDEAKADVYAIRQVQKHRPDMTERVVAHVKRLRVGTNMDKAHDTWAAVEAALKGD